MVREECKKSVLAAVRSAWCHSVTGEIKRCVEVSTQVDCSLFDVARDNVVLEIGPCLFGRRVVLGVGWKIGRNDGCSAFGCAYIDRQPSAFDVIGRFAYDT